MKLPRYLSGRTNVAELSAARAAVRSPAEVARVQQAKFGAIAAGAKAIGDVLTGMQEIKDEEEYQTAITQYSQANAAMESAFDNNPIPVDEFGKLVYDPGEALNKVRSARTKLSADISANIKSRGAKQKFAAYLADEAEASETKYIAKTAEINMEVIQGQQKVDVLSLRQANDFNAADERSKQGLISGAIDLTEYNKQTTETGILRDSDYVYSNLNDPENTPAELNDVLDHLEEQKHPDGTPMLTDEKDLYILRGKVSSKIDSFEEDNEAEKKSLERNTFFDLYSKGLAGDLTLQEYQDAANEIGGFNATYDKILRDFATGVTTENFSNSDDLTMFRSRIDGLKYDFAEDENWKDKADSLLLEINRSSLSHEDKAKYSGEITARIKRLYGDATYQLMARKVYADIAGFEEGMVGSFNINGKYDINVSTAIDARIALMQELEERGTSDGLIEWWNGTPEQPGQKSLFRAKLNSNLITKVMTRPVEFPTNGVISEQWREQVTQSMREWYNSDVGLSNEEKAVDIQKAIDDFEANTSIRITRPVLEPIRVNDG